MQIKSIKQESILKQFRLYFLVAAVIPFFVFIYILIQFTTLGKDFIYTQNFKILLLIAGVFAALGFVGTRSFLLKIVTLSDELKNPILDKIDKDKILELAKEDKEVAQLAKAFSEIISSLENNIKELKEAKSTLYQVLSKIGQAVGSMDNFDLLIKFILETIVSSLGAKRGAIYLLDEESGLLKPKAITGIDEKLIPAQLKFKEEALGWVVSEKKPLFIPRTEAKDSDGLFSSPLIASPLIYHDKVWGGLCLSGKNENQSFSEEELSILSNLAYQIAVSIENMTLNVQVEKTYFETISALALAVEAKDVYSRGHSERVAKFAIKIAEYLGLPQEDLNTIRDAARLHDIGKIGISDEVLHKPAKLSEEEMMIMRKHPEIGAGIVMPLRNFQHIISPIRHHHEFLDGSGYPDGLKSDSLPLVTRILTVADIFDALTSERPYRKSMSLEDTKKEFLIMVDRGKLDRDVVNTIFKMIEENKLNLAEIAATKR